MVTKQLMRSVKQNIYVDGLSVGFLQNLSKKKNGENFAIQTT